MSKVALTMIVKGTDKEPERLERALSSIAPFVDGIFITLTTPANMVKEAEKVCKKYNAHISYYLDKWVATKEAVEWLKEFFGYEPHMRLGDSLFRFDDARNYNLSQVPKEYDWIVWMDTDDIFRGADKLKALAEQADEKKIEAVYFNYLYQVELVDNKIRNVIIEHLRERLVKNNNHFKWIAPIHETLIEQTPTNKTDSMDCDVVHLADQEDRISSLTRNLRNLELSIYETQGKDPRHIYYLAKAFFDIRKPEYDDKTIPLIHTYLEGEHKSGWPEERAQAYEYLSEIYRRRNELNNAIKSCMNALIEQPENPTIMLNVAITYIMKQEWQRALFWVRQASSLPTPKTTLVHNPRDIQGMTLEVLYNASLNLGKIDAAHTAAHQMIELMPENENIQNIVKFIDNLKTQRDVSLRVVELARYLEQTGEFHKIKPLLASCPAIAEQTPFVSELRMKNNPPKPWGESEIALFCGPGFTPWSPKLLDHPSDNFLGGSEEAVVCMSRKLAALGWSVTVYADPANDEGEHDGVLYLPYYKFNRLDNFNILIAWRQPKFFEQDIKYKQGYVWLHDIQNPLDYTKEAIEKTNKFLFLSKWHRDNVPDLPEEKVFVSTNGI